MTTPSNNGEEKFFQLGTKALIIRDDKVLMVKTNPEYSQGKVFWDFPGGRMKQNAGTSQADIQANIQREVKEETGVSNIEVLEFVHAIILPHDVSFKVGLFGLVIFFYRCSIDSNIEIKLSWEHTEYKWFAKHELPIDLQPWYREAIDKILR